MITVYNANSFNYLIFNHHIVSYIMLYNIISDNKIY